MTFFRIFSVFLLITFISPAVLFSYTLEEITDTDFLISKEKATVENQYKDFPEHLKSDASFQRFMDDHIQDLRLAYILENSVNTNGKEIADLYLKVFNINSTIKELASKKNKRGVAMQYRTLTGLLERCRPEFYTNYSSSIARKIRECSSTPEKINLFNEILNLYRDSTYGEKIYFNISIGKLLWDVKITPEIKSKILSLKPEFTKENVKLITSYYSMFTRINDASVFEKSFIGDLQHVEDNLTFNILSSSIKRCISKKYLKTTHSAFSKENLKFRDVDVAKYYEYLVLEDDLIDMVKNFDNE